jgi:hypothetical protein
VFFRLDICKEEAVKTTKAPGFDEVVWERRGEGGVGTTYKLANSLNCFKQK